jgi:hypothetical protein
MTCENCIHYYAWLDGDESCLLRFVMIDKSEADECEDYEEKK